MCMPMSQIIKSLLILNMFPPVILVVGNDDCYSPLNHKPQAFGLVFNCLEAVNASWDKYLAILNWYNNEYLLLEMSDG